MDWQDSVNKIDDYFCWPCFQNYAHTFDVDKVYYYFQYPIASTAQATVTQSAPTRKCLECGSNHWIWNNIFCDYECDDGSIHIRSRFYTDQLNVSKDDEPTLKLDLSHLHIHVSGITPLQNPKKGNKMFIICKLCGEDLEEWKP